MDVASYNGARMLKLTMRRLLRYLDPIYQVWPDKP
jgi:hypothetical protein